MASERPENRDSAGRPPREGFPRETPIYEDQFDPYFHEEQERDALDDREDPVQAEEDWYWREPENIWQDEGMWPWPESAPRSRRTEPLPPHETEPDRT